MVSDFAALVAFGRPIEGEVVIDAHAHLGEWEGYYVPKPAPAQLVECMDRYGIAQAWISAYASLSSDFAYGNDLVAAAVRAFPGRFAGYATPSANYPEEVTAELERCETLGMMGIKLHQWCQGIAEDSERWRPIYEWANAKGKLIMAHCWGSPDYLGGVAQEYPRVSFLIGHLGMEFAPVVRRHDNVYTTTTFVPGPGAIAAAVKAFGAEKILFGSDMPDLDPSLNLGPLLTARIGDEDKRLILGRNMQRLLAECG
ncbi:MAG: amidohydrolase family protein [Anaerolineae bacterium]